MIDPAEPEIPDPVELTEGAQTFVNLDNDDRNEKFDLGTQDTSIPGEDELVKLHLKVSETTPPGTVTLAPTAGGPKVLLWDTSTKNSQLALPLTLDFPADFTIESDGWKIKAVYLEGIAAHTAQQELKLKMNYEGGEGFPAIIEDEVALTIVGIDSIEWVGRDNSLNDDDTLTNDTNHTGVAPAALRVFPGARINGMGVVGAARDKVDVKVTLSVAPVRALKIFFDSFDVDDPTSASAPVDNEFLPDDNRGLPTAGTLTGESLGGILEKTFNNQVETLEFQTTMQPGDNFRIAGNGDLDFVAGLENDDFQLGIFTDDKLRIIDPPITGLYADREILQDENYASTVLTVWRFVHAEVDSMGAVVNNYVAGNIIGFQNPANSDTGTRIDVDNNFLAASPGGDLSPNLSNSTGNGRFENGELTVAAANIIAGITGNGNTYLQRAAGADVTNPGLPFSAIDGRFFGNSTISGTVTLIARNGAAWRYSLNITAQSEIPIDWDDFVGGTITVGANGSAQSITDAIGTAHAVETLTIRIPYTIRDDDVGSGIVSDPDTSTLAARFAPGYVVPKMDIGDNNQNVAFQLNVHPQSNTTVGYDFDQVGTENSPIFWTIYLLGAYQPEAWNTTRNLGDGDSATEGVTLGAVDAIGVGQGLRSFSESFNEAAGAPCSIPQVVAHEVGHLFGGEHADLQLMTGGSCAPVGVGFAPITLNRIRSITNP